MSRECPRCHVPFELVKKPFASIDTCPKCGGLFLDPGEGMALHGADSDPTFLVKDGRAKKLGESALACPSKAHPRRMMGIYAIGAADDAVEIDHCGTCGGVFLDQGEDVALEARVGTSASAPPSSSPFAMPPPSNQERAIAMAQAELNKPAFTSPKGPDVHPDVALWRLATGWGYGRRRHHRY